MAGDQGLNQKVDLLCFYLVSDMEFEIGFISNCGFLCANLKLINRIYQVTRSGATTFLD